MYRRPSKKQQLIRRIIVLIITIFSVLVIVTGTILFILGYRLDSVNGRLEQGALVQFDSQPGGANVTIDGVYTNSQTATKKSLIAGTHSFLVDRDQYEPWNRTLTLEAGTLTWLDYIRLVPKNLQKQTIASYASVHDVAASPDQQMLLVHQKVESPEFDLIDIRNTEARSSRFTLPQSLYSEAGTEGVSHRFMLDEWDNEGRYIIMKHDYRDASEWLVVDTENVESSVNVTRLLSLNLTDLQFAGTSGNVLFGLSDGVIRKLDLAGATISRGLVNNVDSFEMYESNILTYVGRSASDKTKTVAGLYRDGEREPHILRTVDNATTSLRIDTARYYNDDYVAVSEGREVTVLKGSYPSAGQTDNRTLKTVKTFTAPADINQLNFSPEGDYVLAQSGLTYLTYEVEYDRLHESTVETTATEAQRLEWLDQAYLGAVYDGHYSMRDFDGSNVHVIMPMEPGFDATLSQNGRFIYGVNKTDETYRLERVTMILE